MVGPKLNFPGPLFLHFTQKNSIRRGHAFGASASEGLEFLLGEFWNGPGQKQQHKTNQTTAFSSTLALKGYMEKITTDVEKLAIYETLDLLSFLG